MAEIYLSEANFEALFDETIDAASIPTTTNYVAIENYFANLLNGKIGVTSALSADPALSMCRLWVGYAIREFAAYNKLYQQYTSPKKFVDTPSFIDRMKLYDPLIDDIRDTLSSELAPGYYFDFDRYGGGIML